MSPVLEINVRRTNSVRRGLQMIVFVWATVHFFFCPQISDTKHIWIQLIVVLGTLEEQSANCSDLTDQKKKVICGIQRGIKSGNVAEDCTDDKNMIVFDEKTTKIGDEQEGNFREKLFA